MAPSNATALADRPIPQERALSGVRRGDDAFRSLVLAAGVSVLALIVAIAAFLLVRARPAFSLAGRGFFTESSWFPDAIPARFGVATLAFGTVVSSAMAMAIAVPVAVGSALFVTELATARIGRWLSYLVDLLAAVPSVVYGLWGVAFLVPFLVPAERGLDGAVGGLIPIFHSPNGTYGRSLFAASIVLAIMVLPIIAAISREVFRQVPVAQKEAALALGATRWEVIRLSVLPFSRSALVGASMLGLGRALGETIAIALVLSPSFAISAHLVEPGGNTIAANIATKFGESGAVGRQALIASGLVLFAITLLVNVGARAVVARSARRTGILARP